MTTSTANNKTNRPPDLPIRPEGEILTVWQVGYTRFQKLRRSRQARQELLLVVGLMLLLFALPLFSWWRRWLLPGSPQGYAIFVLPLTLAWLWLNRYRLVLPELEMVRQQYLEKREQRRYKPRPERDEKEDSVVRALLEDKPPPPKRLFWPLVVGSVLTCFAMWVNDPTLTCLAFVVMVVGIVGYRQGTRALRMALFPLLFLLTMIPLPGVVLDSVDGFIRSNLFRFVFHVLLNAGLKVELAVEGNPMKVIGTTEQGYFLFAAQVGTGAAQAGVYLLFTLFFLSLIRAPFRAKLFSLVGGIILVTGLLIIRMTLLAWVGTQDQDLVGMLAVLTRWLVPVIAILGQLGLMRLLNCRRYQGWVSV